MKTQFTPGEWYAKDGNVISIETGSTLAIIPYYDRDEKEMEANSKVMAAAPELLNELKNAVVSIQKLLSISQLDMDIKNLYRKDIERHEEAIQKATE